MMRSLLPTLLILVSALTGCGRRLDVVMRHPLQVGVVDQPNTIYRGARHATLTRLDPEAVCFAVTHVQELRDQVPDTRLGLQRIQLRASGSWYPDSMISNETQPQVTSEIRNEQERYVAGREQYCERRATNGRCTRTGTRNIWRNRMVQRTYYTSSSSADICFPNAGRVVLNTDRVGLQVAQDRYYWGLENIAVEVPQQQQTQGGESTDGVGGETSGGAPGGGEVAQP